MMAAFEARQRVPRAPSIGAEAATCRPRRVSVCVVSTCHDRRETTLACLRSLAASEGLDGIDLSMVLFDDGSRDGTAAAVRAGFAWIEVIEGDGSAFWCRGMHRAMARALEGRPDHILWLNDDTRLQPDALARLLATAQALQAAHGPALVVVGSTVDDGIGRVSYGATRRHSRWLPIRFVTIVPTDTPQRCDAMNGNIVLISAAASARLGNLEPRFEHAMGDVDYALRANRADVPVWLAPGAHGWCSDNSRLGTYLDRGLPLPDRWRHMMTRKGLPWRSWLLLVRRHGGPGWPLHFAWPYVKVLLSGAVDGLLPRRRQEPLR